MQDGQQLRLKAQENHVWVPWVPGSLLQLNTICEVLSRLAPDSLEGWSSWSASSILPVRITTEKVVLKLPTAIGLVLGASVVLCFNKELRSGEQPEEDVRSEASAVPRVIPPASLHLLLLQPPLWGGCLESASFCAHVLTVWGCFSPAFFLFTGFGLLLSHWYWPQACLPFALCHGRGISWGSPSGRAS